MRENRKIDVMRESVKLRWEKKKKKRIGMGEREEINGKKKCQFP